MTQYKLVNGVEVELSQAEVDALVAEQQAWQSAALDRALESLRMKRDLLIAETDYLVLPDYPVAASQALLDYRQALRDITNGLTTVEEVQAVVMPVKP